MNTQQAPDYGEPWHEQTATMNKGVHWINTKQFNRAVSCVNACAGMADPPAEMEAMREAIKEAHESLTKANDLLKRAGREYETTWEPRQSWIFWEDKYSAKNAVVGIRQTLAKLQPFIKP